MTEHAPSATTPEVEHHRETIDGHSLHWVTAGHDGDPIVLVHGFPETWWAFHRLIPLLASAHRVVAVDLPGFGDSGNAPDRDDSGSSAAEVLHALIDRLGWGPVHLGSQDLGGSVAVRLAAEHPEDVMSLVAIETQVPGFGFERLADVAHGGAWHVGAIATPGVADFVFTGRVREYLSEKWFPVMARVPGGVTADDIDEFTRAYSRPGAWRGPQGLYRSALDDAEEFGSLVAAGAIRMPVLAVDGMGTPTTAAGMRSISDRVTSTLIDGVGHHVALEAPDDLARVILDFIRSVG